MAMWLQHLLVIAIAVACAVVLAARRIRAMSKGSACDGCAQGGGSSCGPAPGRDVPIPPSALVRRAR